MVCCVFGHRQLMDNENELKEILKNIFFDLIINKKVDTFLFGGFGKFDELCYEIISQMKIIFPHIKRVYCCETEKYITNSLKTPNWLKNGNYEEVVYFHMDYNFFYKRIYFRNYEIVKHSDYCLFYIRKKENSGAYKILQIAQKLKKQFLIV